MGRLSKVQRLNIVLYSLWRFVDGITFYVILSSLWIYLEPFGVEEWFFGMVMASMPLGSSLFGCLTGRLSDWLVNKNVVIIQTGNWISILGHALYSIPLSPYFPLIGRFICGIGSSVRIIVILESSKNVDSPADFPKVFSLLDGLSAIGFTVGPACNLFLEKIDFNLGPLKVDRRNVAGPFMMLLWLLLNVLFWMFAREVDANIKEDAQYKKIEDVPDNNSSIDLEEDELRSLFNIKESETSSTNTSSFLSKEIIALNVTIFFTALGFCINESFCALYLDITFNWSESAISYVFLGNGLNEIIATIVSYRITGQLREHSMLILFTFIYSISSCLMIGLVFSSNTITLSLFIISFYIQTFSMTIVSPFAYSLVTSYTPKHQVGESIGIVYSSYMFGLIVAPLLGSMFVDHVYGFVGFMSGSGFSLFIALVLIFIPSYD